jgi:hypothetical protein
MNHPPTTKTGKCLCGNTATKWRFNSFVCDRCDAIELRQCAPRREGGRRVCEAFTMPYTVTLPGGFR